MLPKQSGTSKNGNPWESQPFVFEYFERPDDRYSDRVVLDTMDTKIMPYIKEGLEVRIGFGHSVREYEGRVFNQLRMYKIESVKKAGLGAAVVQQQTGQPAGQPGPQYGQQQHRQTFPPQQEQSDELPF